MRYTVNSDETGSNCPSWGSYLADESTLDRNWQCGVDDMTNTTIAQKVAAFADADVLATPGYKWDLNLDWHWKVERQDSDGYLTLLASGIADGDDHGYREIRNAISADLEAQKAAQIESEIANQKTADFGSISHGTCNPHETISAMTSTLRELGNVSQADKFEEDYNNLEASADSDEILLEIVEELHDELQTHAPDYGYFGAHPGDGSDLGFWLCEDFEQEMRDDGVLIVSDLADVETDPDNHQTVAIVNCHGNVSYGVVGSDGEYREIWSIV